MRLFPSWSAGSLMIALALSAAGCAKKEIHITPGTAEVLTCDAIKFVADVPAPLTWTTTPSGNATIDSDGAYKQGATVPPGGSATVNVTDEKGDTGSTTVSVAVAKPGTMVTVGTNEGQPAVYENSIAINGARGYAVASRVGGIYLSRSNDTGATWTENSTALATGDGVGCAAVAVDPVDPDRVYVVYAPSIAASLTLKISTNGGAAFSDFPLTVSGIGGAAGEICPSIAAHGPGKVIVVSAIGTWNGFDYTSSVGAWYDAHNGADIGALTATGDANRMNAEHTQTSIDNLAPFNIDANGGRRSPRLATNGNGTTCVTYHTILASGIGGVYAQCTTNGTTWTTPVEIFHDNVQNVPAIAVAADGTITVTYDKPRADFSGNDVMISQSRNGGMTFETPRALPIWADEGGASAPRYPRVTSIGDTLWFMYGDDFYRVIVGKSCDGGRTLGDMVCVNCGATSSDAPDRVEYPFFLTTGNKAYLAGQRPDGFGGGLDLVWKSLQ